MLKGIIAACICLSFLLYFSCLRNQTEEMNFSDLFEAGAPLAVILDETLEEASGISESINNPGYLWTHNDSGDEARIFLIDKQGKIKATVHLDSARNRDWEDIAIGPGPEEGKTYLYIGDIGDNESEHRYKYIYRLQEPVVDVTRTRDTTISDVERIKVKLPDGARDAESLMIDPLTKDLFIISKRELRASVYRVPYPQSSKEVMLAELAIPELELDKVSRVDTVLKDGEALVRGYHPKYYYQIVAADISPDGSEVLVKSYSNVYYWKRKSNESIIQVLNRAPLILQYDPEPQGEAITFDSKGIGYYTINEKMRGKAQQLIYYKRK
jgi:hypothetical protein